MSKNATDMFEPKQEEEPKQVEEEPKQVEEPKPKKQRKPRKPLTDERKAQLVEQLKRGREASLKKRQEGKKVKKEKKNYIDNNLEDEIKELKETIKSLVKSKSSPTPKPQPTHDHGSPKPQPTPTPKPQPTPQPTPQPIPKKSLDAPPKVKRGKFNYSKYFK